MMRQLLRSCVSRFPNSWSCFRGLSSKPEVIAELFWASLHGIAELTRTKRFSLRRRKQRVRALVELFNFSRGETAQGGRAMTVIGALLLPSRATRDESSKRASLMFSPRPRRFRISEHAPNYLYLFCYRAGSRKIWRTVSRIQECNRSLSKRRCQTIEYRI